MRKILHCFFVFSFLVHVDLYGFHQNVVTAQTAPLPSPGMKVDQNNTALVITDPQNDFLSPKGAAWNLVKDSVAENHTIENIELLLKTAKENKFKVFVSPHYYYPYDRKWMFGGAMEHSMHDLNMYQRKGPLSLEGFKGSGADFLDKYKPYIEDGQTVISSPHKIFGPEANDLVLQLRKQGITRVILAGMSGNLCIESHMRELIEQGFEVAVVHDATASAKINDLDGDKAAKINFRMIASASWSTNEAIDKMVGVSPPAAVETCEKGIDLVVISQVSKADVNSYGGYPSPLSCDSFRKYGFVNSLAQPNEGCVFCFIFDKVESFYTKVKCR
jgi:nicotinamidase-related amidase